MPPQPPLTQHDYAYLDCLEGFKRYAKSSLNEAVLESYTSRAGAFERERGFAPSSMAEVSLLMSADLAWQFYCGVHRAAQILVWQAGLDTVNPRRDALRAIMDELEPASPLGRLELDPELELPAWYTENDIHLQPGGFWGDELLGFWFERTAPLIRGRPGWRYGPADPTYLNAWARSAPKRTYQRILDMGCAFGQSTFALRRAYPEAEEVVGIDLSAAVLKWDHLISEEQGMAVTFAQRDASDTRYPDESFDLVAGYILLHEIPLPVITQTVKEAFRVLRPGGHLMFSDAPPYTAQTPETAFLSTYAFRHLGEPFSDSFRAMDFPALVRDVGFVNVEAGNLDGPNPYNYTQWVYRADKPPLS